MPFIKSERYNFTITIQKWGNGHDQKVKNRNKNRGHYAVVDVIKESFIIKFLYTKEA